MSTFEILIWTRSGSDPNFYFCIRFYQVILLSFLGFVLGVSSSLGVITFACFYSKDSVTTISNKITFYPFFTAKKKWRRGRLLSKSLSGFYYYSQWYTFKFVSSLAAAEFFWNEGQGRVGSPWIDSWSTLAWPFEILCLHFHSYNEHAVRVRSIEPLLRLTKNWGNRRIAVEDPFLGNVNMGAFMSAIQTFEFLYPIYFTIVGFLKLPTDPLSSILYCPAK